MGGDNTSVKVIFTYERAGRRCGGYMFFPPRATLFSILTGAMARPPPHPSPGGPSSLCQLRHPEGPVALSEAQSSVSKQGAPRRFEREPPEGTLSPKVGTLHEPPARDAGLLRFLRASPHFPWCSL